MEQTKKDDIKKDIGSKAASLGAQSMGVPKPIADVGGKAASKIASKIPLNPMNNKPLNSFKNNINPTNSYKNSMGNNNENLPKGLDNLKKGYNPSSIPNIPGKPSGNLDQQKNKSSNNSSKSNVLNPLNTQRQQVDDEELQQEKTPSQEVKESLVKMMGFSKNKPSKNAPD